jgi:glycerate 2-kinase
MRIDITTMRILICPDKFKECMTAVHVARHIRNGILRVYPGADCQLIPMADGGEGTVEALVEATGGTFAKCRVHDPLMRIIASGIGISGDGKTAVIEMASASGLALLSREERNPLVTSSYGTGELIRHALDLGCQEIILGIGGSATVDGGVGMAQALGMRFLDAAGQELDPGGGSLGNLNEIDRSALDPRLSQCSISVACDVNNPLTGKNGAATVYGPQKGATADMVKQLDKNLKHLARVIKEIQGTEVEFLSGAGAAGGMGAGIVAFLDGELKPGLETISRVVKLETWIKWAHLVITGEGKMDFQTGFGKTPAGVAVLSNRLHKPVIAFTGALIADPDHFREMGFTGVIPIADMPMTLEHSMDSAGRLLENAAERTFRMIRLGEDL